MKNNLNPQTYWEKRLQSNFDLRSTGHRRFDLEYNTWLYRAQVDCLNYLIRKYEIIVQDKSVIDIGCGTGFFFEYFQNYQPTSLTGIDITQASIDFLKEKFPLGRFFKVDISEPILPIEGNFDFISAMGVLYHIIDDNRFNQAVRNLSQILSPGGYIFISDTFKKPFLPTAQHARHRALDNYLPILETHQIKILNILPLYFFLNRPFIPTIGPWILNTFHLGKLLYKLDTRLRESGIPNMDNLKILVGQKS